MNALKMLAAGLALSITAGTANAATYATQVHDAEYGKCTASASLCASNDRLNSDNALGADSGTFYALGFGGSLTLGFDGAPFSGADLSVFEATFNPPSSDNHYEAADVFSVLGNVETLLGTIYNTLSTNTFKIAGAFDSIKLVDVTRREFASTSSFDGFDVSSVSIAPVPLPAAGAMLLAGLGGFAALRRRKAAA